MTTPAPLTPTDLTSGPTRGEGEPGDRPGSRTRREHGAPREAKPLILTVDDDPSVSRSVARDLRRRYAEECRVVRAESGASALEVIKEVVLRGEGAS